MLVTKREVKQTSKKLLSVLLAVIMMMTSMSVCFGTFTMASAANLGGDYSSYTADPIEFLAEALKSQTITDIANTYNIGNTTNPGSANSNDEVTYVTDVKVATYEQFMEVRDILIYLDKAVKGTECYQTGTADTKDEETKSCVSAGDVEAEILDALGSLGTVSAQAKEFIAYVLEDSKAVQHSAAQKDGASPAKHTATLNVYTEDYKGYLEAHEGGAYNTVDASIEMGFTYSMYMKGGLYYAIKTTCGEDKYNHNAIWVSDYPINAPSAISGKANTAVKTTLTAYANYVDGIIAANTFDVMAAMDLAQIEAIESNLDIETNTIKSYIADEGEGKQDEVYDKFFPGYATKISSFKDTAAKAKEIAKYTETVAEITAYQTNNPDYGVFNWGDFDEATIKADYAEFMGKYSSIINDATLYEYFVKQGSISDTYVKNFRDNVVAYDLEDLKLDKVDPLYETYKDTWNDIELAEKQTAYSNLSGYINNYNGYTSQVKNAIFTSGIDHLLDLQEKLECQVASCVLYFAEHVGVDYSDVSTEDVIAEIGTAKSNLSALNNLKNSVDYTENTALLDGAFENADTFIAYLYSLLAERYTAQVEIVDETYNEIGRPTSNLTLSQYSHLNAYVNGIEQNIVQFLDAEGKGALISAETRAKYAAIETELMPAFRAFEIDRGFNNYSPEDVLIRREDNSEEILRKNDDLDGDGVGEYEVTDENVEHIIDVLEAALKDPTIAGLLGGLINKDENGNPTGEAFSLAGLVTGLLDDVVFTDSLINTIMQFVYPLVLKEFAKVWAGLEPTITVTVPNVVSGLSANVNCGLGLDDVETAIESVGLYIAPTTLAANLRKNFPQYSQAASVLETATSKAKYDKETDTFRNPWENVNLFADVLDETGKPVLNDDGTVKQAYNLKWGVDEAENKREAFVDAAVAALSGLEPLLLALLANKDFVNPDVTDGDPRGIRIGYGIGTATVLIVTVKVTIEPITLTLTFDKNDGWDNALAPIFEALGLTNIPHSEDLQSTRKFLEDGLLAMIDQLIAKLDANPIEFLLDALPNLAYALEGGLVEPLLHQIKSVINYYADAQYDAGITSGSMMDAMKSEEPININIGEMINLQDMGLDISNFAAIWNMLSGVELLKGIEAPDASYIASLGTLVEKDTNRSVKTYTAGTAGKAYHIDANRADVLQYLVKWVLESGLLNGIVKEPSELIAGIFANLQNNSGDAVAAIVELLNQHEYAVDAYTWYDGKSGTPTGLTPADELYLGYDTDWTEAKAEYIYENLDTIVQSVVNTIDAESNFDLEPFLEEKIDSLYTNANITALAKALAVLDLNTTLNKDKTEEEKAKALDVNALINSYLGINLSDFGAYAELADDKNWGFTDGDGEGFAKALATLLAPLNKVLDFIFAGEDIVANINGEEIKLIGYEGYNNAIVPLLEALGCEDVTALADGENALEKLLTVLVARLTSLTQNEYDCAIKEVLDMLPGVLYYLASNGLSQSLIKLLQPVLVIIDTIRPVYDLDINALIGGIEVDFDKDGVKAPLSETVAIDIYNLNVKNIMNIVGALVGLDLTELSTLIYDICNHIGFEYDSASTLESTWMKGAFHEGFDASDLLTVILAFVLDWGVKEDNAKALDELLGIDIIEKLATVFGHIDIEYETPNWMYWFKSQEEFEDYVNGHKELPNTLLALEYPNDWSAESADFIAEHVSELADMVVGLVNKDKEDAAMSVSELLTGLVNQYTTTETLNLVVKAITDLLSTVDTNLIELAGVLLDANIVGLQNYTAPEGIDTVDEFVDELANVLSTYANGLVNWIFFGRGYTFEHTTSGADSIAIDGGLGYKEGLALVLEALGCDVPDADEATIENVLGCLADRVNAILADPVNKIIDILPNIVYFFNANGIGVAAGNILAPAEALIDKLTALGINIDLEGLIGRDIHILDLATIFDMVEDATGLDLTQAESILVDFCMGEISKEKFTYKMTADRKDVVTVLLTVALLLVEADKEKLDEMLGTDLVSAITTVFESAPVSYATPNWYALDEGDIDYDNATIGVIKYAIEYPNNWTEETAKYVADLLESDELDKLIAGLIDENYDSLGAFLGDKVNIYTPDTLKAIQKLLGDLIGGLDSDLKDLVNVGLGAADALLGADVQGLLDYDVSGVKDKETFVAALTGMLMEVEGLVDWLLLGQDYELFVDDKNENGTYDKGEQIITLNGGHGYAEGLALVLEALGVENLPDVYAMEKIDTEAVVSGVLAATFNRFDAILANPVEEVFNILPNVLYFINANGLTVAVDNIIGAINALLIKLEVFGIELDIASLVNFSDILGVETELALDNITMEAVIELVAELTGLNLDKIADVLVGFALGRVAAYDSVSSADISAKMYYHDDFAKYDMVTVLATLAIITLTDDANADKLKEMLGEDIYQLILNLCNMGEVTVQEFDWIYTDKADTGEVFSVIGEAGEFENYTYGEIYTEEMAKYIADNFGEFLTNIITLLGLDVNGDGKSEADLAGVINGLLGGSLYNSANVIAIRDALAGVLANLTNLEVKGTVVGGIIADVLKAADIADIDAVADVKVPDFSDDREQFVESLCDVLEPLYGVLKYVLADEDFTFFVNEKKDDAITLKGAEGYAYGIIPLLEVLKCEDILTPAEYYAAVEADGDVLLTSILNPLLDRVDVILAGDTAQIILDMLTNLIYFVNSNGIDTVVKNTLNAVYALLNAIEPIAKIDLYELIGIDLAVIDFQWIMDMLFELLANAGYEFTMEDIDYVNALTIGKLESYESANGKTAYRMVYAEDESGDKKELVTVILNLLVKFIANDQNKDLVIRFLEDNLGMGETASRYADAMIGLVVDCINDTQLGGEAALATLYYVFYGVDTGIGNTVAGKNNIDKLWQEALAELRKENNAAGDLIEEILGWEIFDDLIDSESLAPNGLIRFFQKIIDIIKSIIEWFKNLFNKAEPATV